MSERSDTPRVDAFHDEHLGDCEDPVVNAMRELWYNFARQLERELAECRRDAERPTMRVYKSDPVYREYLSARFSDRTSTSFEWNGKRYRYLHTDFDDSGDFDLLLIAAISKEPK